MARLKQSFSSIESILYNFQCFLSQFLSKGNIEEMYAEVSQPRLLSRYPTKNSIIVISRNHASFYRQIFAISCNPYCFPYELYIIFTCNLISPLNILLTLCSTTCGLISGILGKDSETQMTMLMVEHLLGYAFSSSPSVGKTDTVYVVPIGLPL